MRSPGCTSVALYLEFEVTMIKVELVDQAIVRQGLKTLLAQAGIAVVAEAGNREEAVRAAARFRPDVAVMETTLPGMNGFEAAQSLLAENPAVRVLFLARTCRKADVTRALEIGAAGYLQKDCDAAELAEAIRAVARGEGFFGTEVREVLKEDSPTALGTATVGNHDALFRAVFENTTDSIFVKDLAHRYLLINPAGARYLGRTVDDVVGRRAEEMLSAEAAAKITRANRRILESCRPFTFENTFETGGCKRTFLTTLDCYRDKTGEVIGIFGIAQDITALKRRQSERLAYHKKVRRMALEHVRAQGEQRHQLAMALHDQIGQNLALAKIRLEQLCSQGYPEFLSTILQEVCSVLSETIKQTRSLTLQLTPALVFEHGLKAALSSLCQEIQDRHGVEVRYLDTKKGDTLPLDVRAVLFQAVRELLVNVVKHAQATRAEVTVHRETNWIRVTVRDNGIGFTRPAKGAAQKGLGMVNIRERVSAIGGEMEVRSSPGEGTTVLLAVPRHPPPPEEVWGDL